MPQMTFIERDGAWRDCAFTAGETIMAVAKRYNLDLEGACGGAMACSTCHVVVAAAWVAKLPRARIEEQDMLDLTTNVTRNSRLGCQIILTDDMDGLIVTVA